MLDERERKEGRRGIIIFTVTVESSPAPLMHIATTCRKEGERKLMIIYFGPSYCPNKSNLLSMAESDFLEPPLCYSTARQYSCSVGQCVQPL